MIFSLILLLTLTNPVHADPPTARLTPQDIQIQQQCRAAVKSDNVDFNECIKFAGIDAELKRRKEAAHRMMEINDAPVAEEITVCKPTEALKVCQESSKRVAMMNNASTPQVELDEQMQNCRVSCNPSSSVVLREYLGGCGPSAKLQKEQMYLIMNNCGQGVATVAEEKDEAAKPSNTVVDSVKEFFGYGAKPAPNLIDQAKMYGLSTGYVIDETNNSTFAISQKTHLSRGVDYVRIQGRDGSEVMRYQSTDGSMHDSFEAAAARSQQAVVVSKLPSSPGPEPEPFRNGRGGSAPRPTEDMRTTTAEGAGLRGDNQETAEMRTSHESRIGGPSDGNTAGGNVDGGTSNPVPAEQKTAGGGGSGGDSRGVEGGDSSGDNYPRSEQPIYQQAGAPGAVLQNALSSPIGGASSFSSPAVAGDMGEVSRGGSGSSSSGGFGGGSGRSSFKGSGRELSPIADNSVTPKAAGAASPEVADMNAAGAGRLSPGGFASAGTGFEGRRVAAVSPSSFGGGGIDIPRSDSFYKTPGSSPVASRSRMVKADPNCRPTKRKPCAMKRISIAGKADSGSGINCDGNPQCILKLTGKIKPSGVLASSDTGVRAGSARSRGVASIESHKKVHVFPVGVRRGGLEDIVQYMQNIGAAHMKLDHEGMLVTDH